MSYSRSYKPEFSKEQEHLFVENIIVSLVRSKTGTYLCQNKYPYDMKDGKKVKTDHWTGFYLMKDYHLEQIIEKYKVFGYIVQENNKENKSIREINHLHFIKEL